jgi:hypothetical protein
MYIYINVIHLQGDSGGPYLTEDHEVHGVQAFKRGNLYELMTPCLNLATAGMSSAV